MAIQEPVRGSSPPVGVDHDETVDQTPGWLLRVVRDQRVAFLIVGGLNTLIGFGWFVLFLHLFGAAIGYMGVLLITHVAAVLCAFTLHRRFVFRVRGHLWLDLGRFELVNLGSLAANAVLLPFFVEIVHLPVIVAQICATFVSVIMTYTGHRLFSFRRRAEHPDKPTSEGSTPAPEHR